MKKLRAYAYAKSPFYKRFHQGLYDAPLKDLPVLTKNELMKNWDEVITDRTVKLKDVQDYMDVWEGGRFRNRYYINITGGTTGFKGIFIYDSDEWRAVLGSYGRSLSFANLGLGIVRPLKNAVVASTYPWHVTAAVGSTSRSRFILNLRIDVTEPVDDIVDKLNAFQPEVLTGYPNMVRLLAREQIDGRLRISPRSVLTSSEVQTEDVRAAIAKAWGVRAFNWYVATETGVVASDCPEHRGLHIYEDLVMPEFVDESNQPVEPGQYSAKVLVTVLFSRTLPLIRYQLEDSICLSKETCSCGRPFPLISDVQGRIQEVTHFEGKSGGDALIQPLFWKGIMKDVSCDGWQIIQTGRSSVTVVILHPENSFNEADFKQSVSNELDKQGSVAPSIDLEYPSSLHRTALGKVALVKALAPTQYIEEVNAL
ncbi:MAG: phenylacetate--CoA ligase family protein [Candidatus Bathyarchaeia archaeon]